MSARDRQKLGISTLLLLLLVFGAAVMATNTLLGGLRIDLTANRLYTLSPGTRALLSGIAEPINLYLFFSDQATEDLPQLRSYADRVRETLEEFAAESEGQLILQVIDPQPFSEDEDRAAQYGLQPVNLGNAGDSVYFGLAGSNSVGATDVIPFFEPNPAKEAFLEYDLARLVYNLAHPDKVVVGLLSGAPISGGFDPQTQQPSQPWVVVQQARQLFEVRALPASVLRVEDDVDVLWVVHPTDTRRHDTVRPRPIHPARRPRARVRRSVRGDTRRVGRSQRFRRRRRVHADEAVRRLGRKILDNRRRGR